QELESAQKELAAEKDRASKAVAEIAQIKAASEKAIADSENASLQAIEAVNESANKRVAQAQKDADDARVQQLDELRRELEAANAETMSARDKQHAEEAARLRAEH